MPLSSLTNMSAATSRSPATKSPCTRAQLRRNQALTDEASTSSGEAELPEELLSFVLTHLAGMSVGGRAMPELGEITLFEEGTGAAVLAESSRFARQWQRASSVSHRWRAAADEVQLWKVARKLVRGGQLNWSELQETEGDKAAKCWQSSSTSREEGKDDTWHACTIPETGDETVVLVRKCSQEGVSYDIVRWIGCLQGMRHPCIAALQMVHTSHVEEVVEDPVTEGTTTLWSARVYAGFERTDTSLQEIVYGTLARTSHTVVGRPLPTLMLRSFLYQLLHSLACCHARGISHGNLAPYRVLAKKLAGEDQYLLKLADFGFSPPTAALCNVDLPIRPSRASPELHADCAFKRYGPANDLWALGTVFAEVACGSRDPTVYMMIQELDSTDETTLKNNLPMMGEDARNLLRKLLRAEPTERITAAEALCHPYFEGIHEQCPVVGQYLPRSMPAAPSFLELRADAWQPGQDFLARQPELNRKMWGILYDWLSVVSYKFKFVPRSLQLACDYMRRYLMDTPIERKRLQLLGIGALCLACKHEEVMIPNMNDFIYICDNAYRLDELMEVEVEMLSSLDAQLHMPTVDDMLLPKLVEIGAALAQPGADTADTTSPLRQWLQCITLIGQAHYPVVLHDPAVLARCVATLGALLWCGQTAEVARPDNGAPEESSTAGALWQRACYLCTEADWACLAELIIAMEQTVKEQRELLRKCHHELVALKALPALLDEFGDEASEAPSRLKTKEVKKLIDTHYPAARCKELKAYESGKPKGEHEHDPHEDGKPPVNMRGQISGNSNAFSIVVVSCAFGKQLLRERTHLLSGMD